MINIITKKAQDTQGGLATIGGGNQEMGFGAVRFGGRAGARGYYRFFVKDFSRDRTELASGQPAADGWHILHGGLRGDWSLSSRDSFTVQGDLYQGSAGLSLSRDIHGPFPSGQTLNDRNSLTGGNVLGRWTRTFSARSNMALQVYFDGYGRDSVTFAEDRKTADVDFQHHFAWGERQDIVWGWGYRFTRGNTRARPVVSFNPVSRSEQLFSFFVQDEIAVVADRVWLTMGSKFEHNVYSGLEIQPSARLLWSPHPSHSLWAAVSRAVRTPARADASLRINMGAVPGPGGAPALMALFGNPHFHSEDLLAYEFGYRAQLSKRVSLDLAGFYNRYEHLRSVEPAAPFFENDPAPPHFVLPVMFGNGLRGETHGLEAASTWQAARRWSMTAAYSLLEMHVHANSTSRDAKSASLIEGNSPQHQFSLRSRFDLPLSLAFDNSMVYVGRLRTGAVPAYTRVDARLGWRPAERLEFSLAGQNLLQPRHPEFGGVGDLSEATPARRSFYGRMAWTF